MKRIVVIPARGGSKGVPGKNIKLLDGKPLIHYTIEAAREVFNDDEIIVSTDDLDIIKCVESTGLKIPFVRPAHLATDKSSTYEVLTHVIQYLNENKIFPDQLILLQATSPFRNGKQIEEALKLYHDDLDMVVSVKEGKANPYFNLFEENENHFLEKSKSGSYTRRQDCPKVWEFNGAIYVINVKSLINNGSLGFKKMVKYEMDELSSHDIDTIFDWKMAEFLIKEINVY
jgi:CMP-N,N'-diacetyllegionaminic acid synthase